MKPIVYEELKVGDEVVTRTGRKAEVVKINDGEKRPILIQVKKGMNRFYCVYVHANGRASKSFIDANDIFLPPKKEYVNLYSAGYRDWDAKGSYSSEQEALEAADKHYKNSKSWQFIKTIEVEL